MFALTKLKILLKFFFNRFNNLAIVLQYCFLLLLTVEIIIIFAIIMIKVLTMKFFKDQTFGFCLIPFDSNSIE